jgi:hypothetical protein
MANEKKIKFVAVMKATKGNSLTKKTTRNKLNGGLLMLLAGNSDIEVMTDVQFDSLNARENGCFTRWSENSSCIDWLESDFQSYADKLINELKLKNLPTSTNLILHESGSWMNVGEYVVLEQLPFREDDCDDILERVKPLPDVLIEHFKYTYDSIESLSAQYIWLYDYVCGMMKKYERNQIDEHYQNEISRILMRLGELKTLLQYYKPISKINSEKARKIRNVKLEEIFIKLKKEKDLSSMSARELWPKFIGMIDASDDFEHVSESGTNPHQPDKWKVLYEDSNGKSRSMKFTTFEQRLTAVKKNL